jgi:hypothetical protein
MSSYTYPVFGLGHWRGGTATSGMTIAERSADNSVEREKFTVTALASGQLACDVGRAMGLHTSLSHMVATGSLGPNISSTEQKTFWLPSDRSKTTGFAAWNIFDSTGSSVNADNGTTNTDVTPDATYNSNS